MTPGMGAAVEIVATFATELLLVSDSVSFPDTLALFVSVPDNAALNEPTMSIVTEALGAGVPMLQVTAPADSRQRLDTVYGVHRESKSGRPFIRRSALRRPR